MATIKMMQGDSYVVFVDLRIQGQPLQPEMLEDVEICIGESLRKTYSGGGVWYDSTSSMWYIRPTQEETLAMEPNTYEAMARVKFKDGTNTDVIGINIGRFMILNGLSEEAI